MLEPAGALGGIVAAKRIELRDRFRDVSLGALRQRALPTRRCLSAAIAAPGARFILEIKKASPSAGLIRAGADAAAIARGYRGVADALSVLTDHQFFGGSLDDLAQARREFDGPILAKDFFIDLRQVTEARIAGADAVLVMLSVLDDAGAIEIIGEARRLGMDALVEVHDRAEMRRALALGAPLIGINNRDFRDLSVDLATTERLAGLAGDRIVVTESGIASPADVERLAGRVDGFLVGSALMRAPSPAQAARALVFGRVKLCGLNRCEDFEAAAPASYAGFVFASGSPRRVGLDQAALLASLARGKGLIAVGIFRDAPLLDVAEAANVLDLGAIQLHGGERAEYVCSLRRQIPEPCEIWTTLSVGRDALVGRGGDRLLFDNGRGGSGRSFDWDLVRDHPAIAEAVIAGGIGPSNALSAAGLGAFAIDVGSAVDASPGVKSAAKMHALFEALRPRCRQKLAQCA
jgi:indole-3-glycerol phosphate synthase/phosphoribosylanthranilate isomerase